MLEDVVLFRINPLSDTVEQFRVNISWRARKKLGYKLTQSVKEAIESSEWNEDYYTNLEYHKGGEQAMEAHIQHHYRHNFWVILDFDYTIKNTGIRKPRTPKPST